MHNKIKLLKKHKDYIFLSFLISLWLVVLGILSVYFTNIIDILSGYLFFSANKNIVLVLIVKSLIIIIIIALLVYLIFKNKKRFKFYSIANEQNLGENKFKAVVLPISLFREYEKLKIEENRQEVSIKFKDDFSFQIKNYENNNNNNIDCVNDFFNEIKKFERLKQNRLGFNWEVPLKIIYKIKKNQTKHPNCLRYVILLGTCNAQNAVNNADNKFQKSSINADNSGNYNNDDNKNKQGSYLQLDKLEKLIKIFFSNNNSDAKDGIKIIKRKLNDFENFTELSEIFEEIEEDIKKEYYQEYIQEERKQLNKNKIKNYENYKEINDTEIAYDITGGQKLVSVVGTFFSLKSQSPILYVSQDNSDNIKVINAIYKMEPPE
ncbi:MAG: hypothetical protein EVJ46_02790 [Candidatus Acididesulfobacter guangdongensis]|uniref:Uncharacterized protein n=1 Tax=Acididesulfobacter guangdongensis TaxID=2597225 RepID=A0A519BIS8_ACIG2|nr:MAG: hypothetical protein EVJ46_02790 [Candidatus Acididesulfobacter guangdongensis]